MVTSSPRCSAVAVVEDKEDLNKERVCNMLLRLLLRKFIKERHLKLQSIEIESVLNAQERVERMEPSQLVQDAEDVDKELK